MKPAGRPLDVVVRANRLDAGASISSERLPEAIADIGVASAGKVIERDLAQKTRLELVGPRRFTRSIPPPAFVVIGKTSRPSALKHSSQAGNGWVAPALATTTSLSRNEMVAQSPLITAT